MMRARKELLVLALLAASCGERGEGAPPADDFTRLGEALAQGPSGEGLAALDARLAGIEARLAAIETRLAAGVAVVSSSPPPALPVAPTEALAGNAPPATAAPLPPPTGGPDHPGSAGEEPFSLTIPRPAEPVSVRLWHSYRGKEKEALEALCADFSARFAPIQVEAQEVPFQALRDKITVTVPRGTGPDLFIFAHNVIGDWVEKGGILVPLGSYVKQHDSFEALADTFLPDTVRALTYQRSLYALPLAFKSHALFFHRGLLPSAPATAEELRRAARAATDLTREADERVYGIVYDAGKLYNHAPWAHGFGAVILDEADAPRLDSEAMAASVAFVRGLAEDGSLPPDISDAMVTSMFNDGRAAMVVNGPWFLGEIDPGVDFGVAPLPEVAPGRPAKPYLGSEGIFLSACAKHPEAAFQVMRFLASDEAALRRYLEGRQLVANRRVWETLEGTGRWDPVLGVFRAQAEAAVVMPSSAKMQPVWSTADNALKRAIFGGGDIGEALQGAQEKAVHDIAAMGK